jgi:hypothetical protein
MVGTRGSPSPTQGSPLVSPISSGMSGRQEIDFASWLESLGRLGCLSMLQDVSRLHVEPSQRVDIRLSDRLDCFIRAKS